MECKRVKNLEPVGLKQIPVMALTEFRDSLISLVGSGLRVVQFFGLQRTRDNRVFAVLADDSASRLHLTSARLNTGGEYLSLSNNIPAFQMFERELAESCGIYPAGHPWFKPVRAEIPGAEYPFFHMSGESVHEVGVGPVHAGIIEPGYFRFSCHGETVDHLEIALGYQHRGVERLFLKRQNHPKALLRLAESIAGDSVIGHAGAYVQAIEALSRIRIHPRAENIRAIALELERIGNHLGDLSALAGDVAYTFGQAVFGALRTHMINTSLALSGSRFGRGLLKTGGVNFDLTPALIRQITETLNLIQDRTGLASDVLFNTASVMARFEKTGTLSKETAAALGMTGPAARASGLSMDVRTDHPFGAYTRFPVHALSLKSGDVFARAYIRSAEIMQSLRIIRHCIENSDSVLSVQEAGPMKPDSLVVSMTEGWRGEIVHIAVTGRNGDLVHYKIKDPSFQNWFGLAQAMRGNGISDFPLCNKSFNLSYCGFDL